MSFVQEIMAAVGITLVSSLLTYFITSIVQRDTYIAVVKELIGHHEQVWHQDSVSNAIEHHARNCEAAKDIKKVKTIVLALFVKQGGNIEDLEL